MCWACLGMLPFIDRKSELISTNFTVYLQLIWEILKPNIHKQLDITRMYVLHGNMLKSYQM